MAHRLAKGVGKPKPTSICPFIFHLYEGQGPLTAYEELDYRTAKEMAEYRINPDPDSLPKIDDDEAIPTPAPLPRPEPSSRHQTGGGSQRIGRQQGRPRSGRGGLRAQFHRNHIRDLSNPSLDQKLNRKQGNWRRNQGGWRSPSLQ